MGRTKYIRVGKYEIAKGKPFRGSTEGDVVEFADSNPGPVASMLWTQKLLAYDADGNLYINRARVAAAADELGAEVVSAREYDKKTFTKYAMDSTDLTPKRALNATDREYAARASAVLIAAKAAGVDLSPAQKRVLNPLARGEFVETVYGKKGQFEGGTLSTRVRAAGAGKTRYQDAGYKARAREKARELREYRYERSVA